MQRALVFVVCLTAATGGAVAAPSYYVAVEANPNLPILSGFRLNRPNRAQILGPPLAGSAVPGVDMLGYQFGWFVTSAGGFGAPEGVYHWVYGASQLVSALPISGGYVGGVTLTDDTDRVLFALHEPSGSTLFDFDGGVLGAPLAITVAGSATEISGLAMDPATDLLYGLDNLRDAILRIDPATGESEVVGSLGVEASGAGGMDFDSDDGRLYITTNVGRLYEVNVSTGFVVDALGQLPFDASGLAWVDVPAPGSVWIIGAIGAASARRRRRRIDSPA